jgi:superfamily II DNA or RNA helicase
MNRSRKRKSSRKKSCIARSKRKPRDIQKRVINYIKRKDSLYDGLLVVHGTGCGKTLAATVASQCYLDKYPKNKVVFVGPASLLNNFKDELKHYGVKNMNKYSFYSFEGFYSLAKKGNRPSCKNALLIIDESHNLRSVKSVRAQSVLKCAYTAHKRLLLTATPFINSPRDFINLINMLYGKEIAGTSQFPVNKMFTKRVADSLAKLLEGRVDYVPSCRASKDFPRMTEKFVEVPMSKQYEKAYVDSISGVRVGGLLIPNPKTFLHGYRKAVNKAGIDTYYSEKLTKALDLIRDSKGKIQKTVIFTNWINFGVKAISKFLKKENIGFRVFRGGLSAATKSEITTEFNDDKFPVLVVTKAGGEGLDLKKVRNIIILDPVWHDAGTQQIIGRAVRYKSHATLPVKDRHVNVLKMMLTFPKGDPRTTGDQMLYKIIDKKRGYQGKIDSILKRASTGAKAKPRKIKIKKKTVKELRAECRSRGLVYDVKTKKCRPSKRKTSRKKSVKKKKSSRKRKTK